MGTSDCIFDPVRPRNDASQRRIRNEVDEVLEVEARISLSRSTVELDLVMKCLLRGGRGLDVSRAPWGVALGYTYINLCT